MFFEIITPIYEIFIKLNNIIYSFGKTAGIISGAIILICGILLLFWGYKIKKIALIIIGFILGVTLGIIAADIFNITNLEFSIILCIVSGLICGCLTYFLYFATVFIIGFFIGGNLGLLIGLFLGLDTLFTIILVIILAIILGILSLKINKIMFIILTAYYGYVLVRIGLYAVNIFGIPGIAEEITAIILLSAGLIFQFISTMNIDPEEESEA